MSSLRKFLENQNFQRIPLTKLNTGHYQFDLKINNRKGTFILDTGASNSCISFEHATHFNLTIQDSDIKAAGAGASDMKTQLSKKNMLQIKRKQINNINLILFDLTHVNMALTEANEEPIHGILGADLLKKVRSVIDYGRNCLYIK